jgi:hypothetical protein
VGRIKGGRAAVDRRHPERVEDALVWRGMGDLRDTSAKRSRSIIVLSVHRRCAVLNALMAAAEALRPSLVEIWEKTRLKCEEMGAVVVRFAAQHLYAPAPFTQESLVGFVGVIKCVWGTSRTLDGAEWQLQRISTLMAILKGELLSIPSVVPMTT